jgi:voltage-gated potassium channel
MPEAVMPEPATAPAEPAREPALRQARTRLVRELAALLDGPMTFLAFAWLVLLILDLTRGLSWWQSALSDGIWVVFVVHFLCEFLIAPAKWDYLKKNWLTAVALLLPALRVFRVFRAFRVLRAARATRGTGLVRLVTALNRGAGALRRSLRWRGVGYVVALTTIVTFAGAAGMYRFENPAALREEGLEGAGISSYGEAVWWTSMTLTTMGSDYFPKTGEGRLLGWALAVYAFAVFGYITATIASYFIGPAKPTASNSAELDELREEIAALRELLAAVARPGPRPAAT